MIQHRLAPSVQAVRQMLKVCEHYASGYDVVSNASKSKCIVSHPQAHRTFISTATVSFYISGKRIDVIDKRYHLGHIMLCSVTVRDPLWDAMFSCVVSVFL